VENATDCAGADAGRVLLVAVGLMVEGTSLGTSFTERFNLDPTLLATWRYFRFSIAVIFAILAVQLLYHFGPNVKQRFRDSLVGAIIAVVTWVGLSYLLGFYFRDFESLNKTYGPLGAAIGLYLWFYLSGFAILLGGEINFLRSELRSRRILRSSTPAAGEITGRTQRRRSPNLRRFRRGTGLFCTESLLDCATALKFSILLSRFADLSLGPPALRLSRSARCQWYAPFVG
jgi:virulence factor BrkB